MVRYEERFKRGPTVQAYDEEEYRDGSYASFIWSLQQPVLARLVAEQRQRMGTLRALDFACGTGRILSFLQPRVEALDGVDISPPMIARAAARVPQAQLATGDVTRDPSLAAGPYGLITAFRFLLNAEDPVRRAVLHALRARIDEREGILIANVHGHEHSLRHFAVSRRRRRLRRAATPDPEAMLHEMGLAQTHELFRASGFRVTQWYGFGVLPEGVHRTPARPVARWVDRACAGATWARRFSIDLMFVCAPIVGHF